jgi:hypothetical protein
MKLCEFLKRVGGRESTIIEYPTEAEALAAVQRDGCALQYVREQTEAICLAAVQQDGYALRYVRDQTEAICLAAIQRDGCALQYVDKRVFGVEMI